MLHDKFNGSVYVILHKWNLNHNLGSFYSIIRFVTGKELFYCFMTVIHKYESL
jgi:hypothetical protein